MVATIDKEQYSTFVERTLTATGVSRRTLFNIRKELRETGTRTSPTMQASDNVADVLQRKLLVVVDLGAHTDSETDTASEAE